jgi:cyclophilin family peptidyl-prolyl cis-trans isomerase
MGLIVVTCACGGDDDAPDAPDASLPADAGQAAGPFSVVFTTTAGEFILDVTPEWSPIGAARFRELVEAGFYDGCRFFRVVPGFVVQFGMNGDPTTNAMWSNMPIGDDPVVESNVRGSVTFATSGPSSRTTQLFINYSDNSFLDSQGFSPFAVVRTGLANIDGINDEYGEQPDQQLIGSQGNVYLDANFPRLDSITTARVEQ